VFFFIIHDTNVTQRTTLHMGCDGGTIPKRHELVKTKPKTEKADAEVQNKTRWFFCALSKEPLRQPVVACPLGRLYNKQAIIEFLLDKTAFGDGDKICNHITSLKLMTDLKLMENPAARESSPQTTLQTATIDHATIAPFICPITMKEMNGKSRFIFLTNCGCVMSEQALKNVPSRACLVCNEPFIENDIVPIHSTQKEELTRLDDRLKDLTASIHAKEAERKAKRREKEAKEAKKKQKTEPRINLELPKLEFDQKKPSLAIQSLYSTSKAGKVDNNLFSGTFNRYSAFSK
jgi:hypothetical protein